uniref:Uncharacterized protein n=1 Tax=Parascaris univalens TaxID=6257 RepID=A0A914ZSR3_PARUN
MIKLRSAALSVAGVFLSAAVIAAVLALALWDFKSHNTQKNLLYGVGVLLSFILNFIISGSLVQGIRFNMPQLMLPYIVCASFHLLISMISIIFFALSAFDSHSSNGFTQLQSFYILIFFI